MSSGARIVYWDEKVETNSREQLLFVQWERLKGFLRYILEHSPFYRKKLSEFQKDDVDSITIEAYRAYPLKKRHPHQEPMTKLLMGDEVKYAI